MYMYMHSRVFVDSRQCNKHALLCTARGLNIIRLHVTILGSDGVYIFPHFPAPSKRVCLGLIALVHDWRTHRSLQAPFHSCSVPQGFRQRTSSTTPCRDCSCHNRRRYTLTEHATEAKPSVSQNTLYRGKLICDGNTHHNVERF